MTKTALKVMILDFLSIIHMIHTMMAMNKLAIAILLVMGSFALLGCNSASSGAVTARDESRLDLVLVNSDKKHKFRLYLAFKHENVEFGRIEVVELTPGERRKLDFKIPNEAMVRVDVVPFAVRSEADGRFDPTVDGEFVLQTPHKDSQLCLEVSMDGLALNREPRS